MLTTIINLVQRQKGHYVCCWLRPSSRDWYVTLYLSGLEPHTSLSLGKPQCNASRVDIRPDHSHHIKVTQGYTNSGFWNITSKSSISSPCHLLAILTIPLDVTSAAHSLFFAANFKMPNITQPLIGHGEFINAPHNRFGTYLQDYGRSVFWSGPFSFLTVTRNSTTKDTEVTQVDNKSCIGTVIISQYSSLPFLLTWSSICRLIRKPVSSRLKAVYSLLPQDTSGSNTRRRLFPSTVLFCLCLANLNLQRAPLANPKGGKHSRCMSSR